MSVNSTDPRLKFYMMGRRITTLERTVKQLVEQLAELQTRVK